MRDGAILRVEGLDAALWPGAGPVGVSLEVARGEVVALMVAERRRRIDTLKAIIGLLPARAPHAAFAGRDIVGMAGYRVARLGSADVPEDRRILPIYRGREPGGRQPGARHWQRPRRVDAERLFQVFPNLAEMRDGEPAICRVVEQQMPP